MGCDDLSNSLPAPIEFQRDKRHVMLLSLFFFNICAIHLGHCVLTNGAPGGFPNLLMIPSEPSGRDLQSETGPGLGNSKNEQNMRNTSWNVFANN